MTMIYKKQKLTEEDVERIALKYSEGYAPEYGG